MLKHMPRISGIYQIKCTSNGKFYIGSAIDMHDRCEHHRSSLRWKNHINSHLQCAWDKYGENNFEFAVLEPVEKSRLLKAEQEWLDKTRCFEREIGFNICPTAGSPGDINAQIWEGFIDPNGNELTIKNLFNFCRQKALDFPSMHRLFKGKSKLKSYKGWTHKNSVRQRDYIKTYDGFIDPNGNAASLITNLAAFCCENDLDNTHMVAVAHGRLHSHKGLTYNNSRQNLGIKTYTGFINPNGERVAITNLQNYCRENELGAAHMHEIISGKRKNYKGWKWEMLNE
ncbi:MAG: GIY-YIG nuclease family protein [Chloroflexi bacterium]|nr:GIY-YIG nuclease family protein [Chloroflexota bacterium]